MAHERAANSQDAVIDRYSGLARIAAAGGTPVDGDPDACTAGCFGAAAYPGGAEGAPEAALRASLGCGNPLAFANLQPGEIVLDLGSGGGLDVLLSARRVAPGGVAYGLDASADMLADAEQRTGCISGTLTLRRYRDMLQGAGFNGITITKTHPAGGGIHSAIIRAVRPTASPS